MLTVVNCVQQDWESLKPVCLQVELGKSRAMHVHSQPASVTEAAGNPIPVPWHDVEKARATVSLPDLVVLPITRWLPCNLMVKLFGDHIVTTFHQADRSSQSGFLLMQLQDKISVDCWQILALLPETDPVVAVGHLNPNIVIQVAILDTNCLPYLPLQRSVV